MVVLIADKFSGPGKQRLEKLGFVVELRPDLGADGIPAALAETGADILVVRSTKVTRAAIEGGPHLALVIRAGAGVNTIDLAAASERGVFVANCPGKNAIAVAELTMGLLLAVDRSLPDAVAEMRQGRWNKKRFGKARGLFGRRLGLIGFGAIAQEVARRAVAFGLRVSAYARTLDDETAATHDVTRAPSLDALLAESDIVSVHVPYGQATHHLLDAAALAKMKPGAVLIHTARGGVVDDAALADAVARGHLRAALDVFEDEPKPAEAPFHSALRTVDGVYATPHIGASTEQAEAAIADETVRIIHDYRDRGVVHHAVNVVTDRPARWTIVVRHLDRVGVLAGVLGALREDQLNVQEMQNTVFSGNQAASATITLEREPSRAMLDALRAQADILAVEVRAVAG
jgi:D-3-phosphoglycerate dehydrogenase